MIQNVEEETKKILQWIQNYIKKANAKGVVIGNSGGKDSATAIALATKALGKENVLTVAMPCHSISKDKEDAKLVAETFGVKLIEIDLSESYSLLEKTIATTLEKEEISKEIAKEADINARPRLRMTTLYMIAQTLNYLVMGTGNLCEIMVGYTTKWGDSGCDFNPIRNFTVEEVLQIGKYLGVPSEIIEKKPSDGLGVLTDEENLGVTYKQIAEYIDTGRTEKTAMKIIERKYDTSQHKRSLVPYYPYHRKNYLDS